MSEPDRPPLPPVSPRPRWHAGTIHARRRLGSLLVRLVFELFVVFCGVYGAFALSRYQEAREEARRRAQIEQALGVEIRDIATNTRRAAQQTAGALAVYDSLWAAGQQPPLQPLIEPVGFQTHIWETTLQSGGLELLGVETGYQLSEFYNQLNAGFEQLAQLRQLSETMILPHLDDPAAFYDPATGRLRAGYGWYVQGIRNLHEQAAAITAMGDSLASALER